MLRLVKADPINRMVLFLGTVRGCFTRRIRNEFKDLTLLLLLLFIVLGFLTLQVLKLINYSASHNNFIEIFEV